MDREQEEMQFIGLFGMYKESIKIIITWRKIFSQITLTLILPLTFIFLAHMEVSNLIFRDIRHTEYEKDVSAPGSKRFNKLSESLSAEWITYWLFKAAYFTFLLVFSLLATAAVVYTIACIYTGRELSFKKVMSVVPKVWKRLMLTFLSILIGIFLYHVGAILLLVILQVALPDNIFGTIMFHLWLIAYLIGFVYLTIIWQLATVVSVLETLYAFRAMVKSRELIKGKQWTAILIFFKLNFSLAAIQILFEIFVVHGRSLGMLLRLAYGLLCFLLLFKLVLFGLVIQTVLYFVCKSYHHENIDKGSLSSHLEAYLGEYEPLKEQDLQLEHFDI